MFRLTRASESELQDLLEHARTLEPSYEAVGATRDPTGLPPGYRHDVSQCDISGPDAFARARQGLKSWQTHHGAGARVFPETFGAGETVLVLLGMGPSQVIAPCRIVYLIDEADRFGFAYGTLPGHPEEGEEAFMAARSDKEGILFTITAFSRPAERLVKVASPIARLLQQRTTKRYQEGLRHFVRSGTP